MDRDQNASEDLMERRGRIIADILSTFGQLVRQGTEKVDSTVTIGQTGYSSMALDILMNTLIKLIEDLLGLTRQLRELWIAGPLRLPGAGDDEAESALQQDAATVFSILATLRNQSRQRAAEATRESHGYVTYVSGPVDGPPPPIDPKAVAAAPGTGVLSAEAAALLKPFNVVDTRRAPMSGMVGKGAVRK
ncbi:hypothetical protein B0H63DRAFT_488322 [Podospora didyma]|uniref:Uncharacterized protein n=1 Tax=Podospora didyma TaxID=330526 RepID=A0AAE0K1J4_9PEZI|nr:hypothetical protein B0H63DRAFT_488322 [Podospora didyma]